MTFILVCGLLIAPMYAGQIDLYYRLLERFANYSPYVLGEGQYYRILTANFLHAGLVHFSFNAFALYLFGRPVERTWGRMTTFWVLLLSGIGGHYVSALFHPNSASVGASTSVYGILALYVLTFVRYRAPGLDRFRNRRIIFLLLLILGDIGLSLTEPMIDTPGHLGGLFVGTLLGMGIIVGDSRRQKKRAGGNPPTPP
jgi:rhomboid protease GluP